MPLGLEFDYVQLAGQPASGEREAWNADALMEGVRVGTKSSEFLSALEDRVGAEEARWTPLLELHYPDLLDDYLNEILVQTGQRFFKKEPMDAPDYSDLAAKRRELLAQRLEARKSIDEDRFLGQEGVESAEELQQRVRTAKEQLASTSAIFKAIRLRLRRRRQSFYEEELRLAWKTRDVAATFRWSRLLGGRRWGAKKRDYRAMSAALPSKKAWKDEWTKPGAEGGMGAVALESWSECENPVARSCETVRAQCQSVGGFEVGLGGVEEQLPHCKEEKSLPSRNASCRTLDNASPCLP